MNKTKVVYKKNVNTSVYILFVYVLIHFLMCKILIGSKNYFFLVKCSEIIFNIEKLISTIYESIIIIYINKCIV
jgi:hypothetical protein